MLFVCFGSEPLACVLYIAFIHSTRTSIALGLLLSEAVPRLLGTRYNVVTPHSRLLVLATGTAVLSNRRLCRTIVLGVQLYYEYSSIKAWSSVLGVLYVGVRQSKLHNCSPRVKNRISKANKSGTHKIVLIADEIFAKVTKRDNVVPTASQ